MFNYSFCLSFLDDDECLAGIHNCPGQCINTEGSYLCNCTGIPGYLPGENRPCKGKQLTRKDHLEFPNSQGQLYLYL